jgi:hypothetical protein
LERIEFVGNNTSGVKLVLPFGVEYGKIPADGQNDMLAAGARGIFEK